MTREEALQFIQDLKDLGVPVTVDVNIFVEENEGSPSPPPSPPPDDIERPEYVVDMTAGHDDKPHILVMVQVGEKGSGVPIMGILEPRERIPNETILEINRKNVLVDGGKTARMWWEHFAGDDRQKYFRREDLHKIV